MEVQHFDGVRLYICNTAVVGSGTAGLSATDRLWTQGQHDIVLVTEDINAGTSRNTGSDKQTYYKLTLSGKEPDSVGEMARTLFSGQCVDGDLALCEAALSVQGFLKLVELGVPFPKNRYGEYIGYKTDHDPRRRATSVGPYTSRCMTECLEKAVRDKGVPILDRLQVISVLSDGKKACGLVCLDRDAAAVPEERFVLLSCKNIVYATGGPAGMYADNVYPSSQCGATGLAFEAGVCGKNLTEWQYGLASTDPRWNVSGTYMQALPRVVSVAPDGSNEREFLLDFFTDTADMLTKVFLKGYQWPFDVRKVEGGSSIIDLLVYLETCKGRRVFLDYRTNPGGGEVDFDALSQEAREYLRRAGACFGTPFQRLLHMNAPAVAFYRDHGVDLASQPLEIALCVQHNNGGLSVDAWWQTNVEGFFAVGEVAASHGVYRPGGTALNAGQVGAIRAASYIAECRTGAPDDAELFAAHAHRALRQVRALAKSALSGGEANVQAIWDTAAARMSRTAACIRCGTQIEEAIHAVREQIAAYPSMVRAAGAEELHKVFRVRQVLFCQFVYLSAMENYLSKGGKSRGSALYTDPSGKKPYAVLPDTLTFALDDGTWGDSVQEVQFEGGECRFTWRSVRPIPQDDDMFENVWRGYRKNKNIF